jgi:hypothetical protein
MGHPSTPFFRTFHALRIKGFATLDTLAEITSLELDDVESHVLTLAESEHALFRENRGLWQLTPAGREAHPPALVPISAKSMPSRSLRRPIPNSSRSTSASRTSVVPGNSRATYRMTIPMPTMTPASSNNLSH